MTPTHQTAPTLFTEVNGVRVAYRRFGSDTGIPVVFLQHFAGTMDSWDPAVVDGFADEREVILFDNIGVSRSSGVTPTTISAMADDAFGFLTALGVTRVDLLGFSLGGYIAQVLTARYPNLVRRLILAGTGPEGGVGIAALEQVVADGVRASPDEPRLYLFFETSAHSQNAGHAFISRQSRRPLEHGTAISGDTFAAQSKAIVDWGRSPGSHAAKRLEAMTQPVLVVNGKRDIMVPTENSYELFRRIPNATLMLYPDAGHGALFQYADTFVHEGLRFLGPDTPDPEPQPARSRSAAGARPPDRW